MVKRASYPEACIQELFEQQAERTPEAIALIDGTSQYTYAELNAKANQLARVLQAYGVSRERFVGCHLRRSSAITLYLLAILKAGGAYVLLDPELPPKRLQYLIANAGPALIVEDDPVDASVTHGEIQIVSIRNIGRAAQTQDKGNLPSASDLDSAAYIAYTSGSTGLPKGVVITQRSVVNHSWAFARSFKVSRRDRVPLMASIAFDVATEEMIPPLMAGATLIVSSNQHTIMSEFNREIIDNEYTVLNIPAPLWHSWTAYLHENNLPVPGSLRLVITGSDKVQARRFAEWKKLTGSKRVEFVAAYGTTETAVSSAFYTTAWEDNLEDETVLPIGRPIANTSLYILDETNAPVLPGRMGELYIGGDGVGRGYHMLPEKTRECFMSDPFADHLGGRMYKTGDLARARADGNIVVVGRTDTQVKLGALRIELGEIEAALTAHPKVGDTAVVLRNVGDQEEDKSLVAFIAPKKSHEPPTQSALNRFAREHLDRRMVPSRFIVLACLPRNLSGKIDRKELEQYAVNHA